MHTSSSIKVLHILLELHVSNFNIYGSQLNYLDRRNETEKNEIHHKEKLFDCMNAHFIRSQ